MGAFALVSVALVLGASGLPHRQSAGSGSVPNKQDSAANFPTLQLAASSSTPSHLGRDEYSSVVPKAIVANRNTDWSIDSEDVDNDSGHGHVPPIDSFSSLWEKRYESESRLSEPLPSSIRLVLGLFTVPQDAEYRKVVRRTWFNQTGVCYWQTEPQEGCQVYLAFVIGKFGVGEGAIGVNLLSEDMAEAHREPGMFVLDMEENMNYGKSLVWFREALKAFPWATHIGKMDMDTYPFIHKLVSRMAWTGEECMSVLRGYEFIGRPHNPHFSTEFQSACTERTCLRQYVGSQDRRYMVAKPGGPFKFMSGEFYILSYPLVEKVEWESNELATEDSVVAHVVDKAAQKNKFCVVARRLDSWVHGQSELWVNGTFADDF